MKKLDAPKTICVTGNIGTGKSYVCNIFRNLGFPIYNTDIEAKNIVIADEVVKNSIVELLGKDAYLESGEYNRAYVASKIFADDILLKKLNKIIHPAVAKHYSDWLKEQSSSWVIKESALIFEAKLQKGCDKILLVTAPLQTRIERLKIRDKISVDQILNKMSKQISDHEKIGAVDFVIENDGIQDVQVQVNTFINQFLSSK